MQPAQKFHPTITSKTPDTDILDKITTEKIDVGIFITRLSIGGLMLFHGINKLMYGTDQVAHILESVGLPVIFTFGVLLAEVLAPVMLIIGFKVRLAAFLVAIDMFMAALLVHSEELFKISDIGGWQIELNALYFFGALALLFFGSGRIAVTRGKGMLD